MRPPHLRLWDFRTNSGDMRSNYALTRMIKNGLTSGGWDMEAAWPKLQTGMDIYDTANTTNFRTVSEDRLTRASLKERPTSTIRVPGRRIPALVQSNDLRLGLTASAIPCTLHRSAGHAQDGVRTAGTPCCAARRLPTTRWPASRARWGCSDLSQRARR